MEVSQGPIGDSSCAMLRRCVEDIDAEGIKATMNDDIHDILQCRTIEDWEDLHVIAMFHAQYFSLRMLKQVLSVVKEPMQFKGLHFHGMNALSKQLESLPDIRTMLRLSTE